MGVKVGVCVVGVCRGLGVMVADDRHVAVWLGRGVGLTVTVLLGLGDDVTVRVAVIDGLGLIVRVKEGVAVRVAVLVHDGVTDGVLEGVTVLEWVAVGSGVCVLVGVMVGVYGTGGTKVPPLVNTWIVSPPTW